MNATTDGIPDRGGGRTRREEPAAVGCFDGWSAVSVIAVFTVPYPEFALGRALDANSGIEVRLESIVPAGEQVMPYFWVSKSDAPTIEERLKSDPVTKAVSQIDQANGEVLFRVDWSPEINGLVATILDSDAVVLEAEGTGDVWSLRLRFPNYEELSGFYQECAGRDVSLELEKVHEPAESGNERTYGLTDEQRTTLLAALDGGYYAVPRKMTLEDLADSLGISDSAASQRLRRGLTTLLTATLLDESDLPAQVDD